MKVMNPGLVRWARRFDWVWRLLGLLAGMRRERVAERASLDPARILVLDLHLIGDMVMLLPFLGALRRRYPGAQITLVAGPWCHAVLAASGAADRVVEFAAPWVKGQGAWQSLLRTQSLIRTLRAERWDLGIDMRGDIRNILTLYFARCVQRVGFDFTGGGSLLTKVVPDNGVLSPILEHHERLAASLDAFDGRPFVPRLTLSAVESRAADEIAPYVGFHFGASLPLRRLPVPEAANLLSTCAGAHDGRLIVFSAPDVEAYVAEVLSQLGPEQRSRFEVWRGDLRGFIVTASRARLLYTMDSGPAHLAAAIGCKTVVMFGPNRSAFVAPRGSNVRCVELDPALPCQPCDQRRCLHPTVFQACLRGMVPLARAAAESLSDAAENAEVAPDPPSQISPSKLPAVSQRP